MVEQFDFRQTLSRFASGVCVVTMRDGETDYGLTVTAFMSVSLEPPLIAVSVDKGAKAHPTLARSRQFGVSILADGQEALADLHAGRRNAGTPRMQHRNGFPVVEGALAWLLCTTFDSHDAGDHTIFVGQVEELGYLNEGEPLVHFRSRYSRLRQLDLVD